jgi:uncharacterized protein YyaL (SSP411 family)
MFDPLNGGFGNAPKFPHPAALDLLIDNYARTGDEHLRNVFVTTLEKMANGGVYDQLAGGFHRYSVDERWVVPHFEKMIYDNSELLKNYVHAYQATGSKFFAEVARDIIRWMDEWLSDRERGGFYASQDADYSMEDDGDYFTWTVSEAKQVLTEDEFNVASLRYDINEVGEMHHNPAKNVLYVRASLDEIANHLQWPLERVQGLLEAAKQKMYAARLKRPTPYVDKTIYTGWNAMAVSAYLEGARALNLPHVRRFALRSLDRILSDAWHPERGLTHVIAYSDPDAAHREIAGVLDDYAFTANACLDAYEVTADLTYFTFARRIADFMITRFFDPLAGGFFDTPPHAGALGVLGTRRKPFQDSPTPAGNSVAAIALVRLHSYTNDAGYRDKAEDTLELLANTAEQYGIFAASYGIAAVHFTRPHVQVVILGTGVLADQLESTAKVPFAVTKTVVRLAASELARPNLPPSLAETLPSLPAAKNGESAAVLCSNFACQPPITDVQQLANALLAAIQSK